MLVPDLSPARSLIKAAAQHPQRLSLVGAHRQWTVAQSAETIQRMAAYLQQQGVRAGDTVVIISANSPWHFLTHVACAWLHAVTVPMSPKLAPTEILALLSDADPHVVIYSAAVADTIHSADLRACLCPLADLPDTVQECPPINTEPLPCSDEPAAIVFTSGSSGHPRGVVLSHANLWWATMGFRDGFEYTPGVDVVAVCAPISHVGGFNGGTLDTFAHGGTVVVIDAFKPGPVLDLIEQYHVSMMFIVPTMARALVDEQLSQPRDLHRWRLPLVGGDMMDPALDLKMRSIGLSAVHVWGMTELSAAGAWLAPDVAARHRGAIGIAFPFMDLRLKDTDGRDITAPHQPGIVHMRGPNVADHYLDGAKLSGIDGFFSTGDVGEYDEDGYVFFLGRASRLINTGGEMVSPAHVEAQIRALEGVNDVLVVGLPDERWGQIVGAIIVGEYRSDATVRQQLRNALAPWELPRQLVWASSLPVTAVGKPDITEAGKLFHK